MKQLYFLLLLCGLGATTVSAQTYVDASATGADDGSSWDNAYTNLTAALDASTEGDEIWVAAGTYMPETDSAGIGLSYIFPHDLQLYGGFEGSETSREQRDPTLNNSVLTGDIRGDDVENDYTTNREDNSLHVFFLTDTITSASTIDGFIIRNGTTQDGSGSGNGRRGGGILTYGNPSVRNCVFTQNFGHFGGGMYPRGTDKMVIENCQFVNNYTSWGGGGIYINSDSAQVTRCSFMGNISETRRGAGLASFQCAITIDRCSFTSNRALDSSGGGVHIEADDDSDVQIQSSISNSEFVGNTGRFGGAIATYGNRNTVTIEDCNITDNTSTGVGGALSNAFGSLVTLQRCNITDNTCESSGGAVYNQNNSGGVTVRNCNVSSNSAERGGAFAISGDDETSDEPLPLLIVQNSVLEANIAIVQGGAVNLNNANSSIVSTLINLNLVTNVDGAGGGIIYNVSDSLVATHELINSTLVDNIAGVGNAMSTFSTVDRDSIIGGVQTVTIQNTILDSQDGDNYVLEAGDTEIISNGGNLSSDASTDGIFTDALDQNSTDPEFTDAGNFDYTLQLSSPAIDAGVAAGAPATDILGQERINAPDIGAYENQDVLNGTRVERLDGELTLTPNPAVNITQMNVSGQWTGRASVQVVASDGRAVLQREFDKDAFALNLPLDVSSLTQGSYIIVVRTDEGSLHRVLVKK